MSSFDAIFLTLRSFFGGLTRNAASNPEMGYFYDVDSGRTAFTVYHEDSHKHMFRTVQRP